MRDDPLHTSTPAQIDRVLNHRWCECDVVNPISILKSPGNKTGVGPEDINAAVFSHMHFDHSGEMGRGLPKAELWLGPSACSFVRPGYPADPEAPHWETDLPKDGSRKIVEWTVPQERLQSEGDNRHGKIEDALKAGKYEAVERRVPDKGWESVGPFERGANVFGDGSFYLIDAPGHAPGHQLALVRVKEDDYVLLSGDAYHHPDVLKTPELMARPPYSFEGRTMHPEWEKSLDVIRRANKWAQQDNVWAVAAHDTAIGEAITGKKGDVEGVICLDDWKAKGWKKQQV